MLLSRCRTNPFVLPVSLPVHAARSSMSDTQYPLIIKEYLWQTTKKTEKYIYVIRLKKAEGLSIIDFTL